MFYFLIQVVVSQVFSFCRTSLGSKFMIHALFCTYVILPKKKKNSLLKSEALTSPSLREALIRFRLGGLSRHGLLYPSTSTLRTALLGTFTGKQQGCKAPQGSGRPYMSWMNSLAEPTCVNIPHLTILRKYLGRP